MVTVLQISDTHFRAEPHTPTHRDPDAALSATIAAVRDLGADLVVLTGDLTDDGSLPALERLRDTIGQLSAPILAVAGNHDDAPNVREVFGSVDTVELGAWRVLNQQRPRRSCTTCSCNKNSKANIGCR